MFTVAFMFILVDLVARFREAYRRKRIPSNWTVGMT